MLARMLDLQDADFGRYQVGTDDKQESVNRFNATIHFS